MQHCPGEEEEKKARIAMVEEELKEGYILDYIVCFVKFLIPQTYLWFQYEQQPKLELKTEFLQLFCTPLTCTASNWADKAKEAYAKLRVCFK